MDANVRQEILQLLADGKISAAEAVSLLDGKTVPAAEEAPAAETIEELKASETIEPSADDIPVEELKSDESTAFKISRDEIFPATSGDDRPRWLKIRVSELDSGRNRVNVTIPLGIVDFGLGIARRFRGDSVKIAQAGELWQMVQDGQRGVLVDVEDEEDNEHVLILLD